MNKNILIIIPYLALGGGAERIAAILADKFQEKGNTVSFLTFYSPSKKYASNVCEFSLNERMSKNFVVNSFKLFQRSRKIAKFCKENKIDTCISFMEEANFSTIISKYFGNKAKMNVAIRINPKIFLTDIIYNNLIRKLYPKAENILVQNEGSKYALEKYFSIKGSKIIPNFFSLTKFKKLEKDKLPKKYESFFKNSKVCINIGRLESQKDQINLIKAFKLISAEDDEFKLAILGEGTLKPNLNNLIKKLNLTDKVILVPNQKNVFPFLRESYMFLFTSIFEGMPNVLVEALYMNLPIISTDCPFGPREIFEPNLSIQKKVKYPYLGEYGILTDLLKSKEEIEVFANAVLNLDRDKKLLKKYSKGIERVKQFNINEIIKLWEDIL